MKRIDHITHVYFLGIGGIGMSALARYFNTRGVSVCGYDKTPSALTRKLEKEGIRVSYSDDPAGIPVMPEIVVRTPAVPESSALFRYFSEQGVEIMKRAEVLGILSEQTPTIAVAGTHGKTTISAMLAHIMKTAGRPCLAFLGGISTNYDTNYIGEPEPEWLIAEADEFDRSFLQLSPEIALVSAIDPDHLDIYENHGELVRAFQDFTRLLPESGSLVCRSGLAELLGCKGKAWEYGERGDAEYYIENIRIIEGRYVADLKGKLDIPNATFGQPGRHNLENALGAAALADQAGIDAESIRNALASFSGVKRRFELCLHTEKTVYVDDYAHHPEEIRACIASAKEMWPGKKITGVFQPHLYSRTRDLAGDFAKSLSLLDRLILLEIYPAREMPVEGVSSAMLLNMASLKDAVLCKREELMDVLANEETEVLLTMGAGDIDRFPERITQLLKKKSIG